MSDSTGLEGASIRVSEIFGPTLQGEGWSAGVPAIFLRVAGCHLACTWCDTSYAWDWSRHDRAENTKLLSVPDVWSRVQELASGGPVKTLVISGGEPALAAKPLAIVAHLAKGEGWDVEVETSGTLPLGPLIPHLSIITVSPKLSNSNLPEAQRLVPNVLEELAHVPSVVWKFVAETVDDLVEVDALVEAYALSPVIVMPQARSRAELNQRLRQLAPSVIARGYRLSTRLQVEIWDGERGR